MNEKPLISIVIPTHADRAKRLQMALASVWAQEGLGESFDVEPIVVDDGSTGPTRQVVDHFPGTRYVRLDRNSGISAARNAGIAESTGDFLAFLDDDDSWLPHRLSSHVGGLQASEATEVVYGQLIVVENGSSELSPGGRPPSGWIFETIARGALRLGAVMVPKVVLETVGVFDESLHDGEDTDWMLRTGLRFPFRYIAGAIALYMPSSRDWTVLADDKVRSWEKRKAKLLSLIQGAPNESEIAAVIRSAVSVHMVTALLKGGKLDDARTVLLRALEEVPPLRTDGWYESRIKDLALQLSLASDSSEAVGSLLMDLKRTSRRGDLPSRLTMRALLADIWTAMALHYGSSLRRDDRRAGAAAIKAVLQNPLQPVSRPGLLRLLGRAVVPA